jgi:hypothetical protein
MKNDKMLDLYIDYLISAFGRTTTTGLSALLNDEISHDSVQRFLAEERKTSADASLCGFVKLELLKDTTKLNHFALKSKFYLHALPSAYATLREVHPVSLAM